MKRRLIFESILIAYGAILIKLVVFKNIQLKIGPLRFRFTARGARQANLLPFKTILGYLLGEHGQMMAIVNLLGNIALFVPVGFLVPFVYRTMMWQESIALGVAVGLTMEGMEMVFRVGIFDIDDVILNALGVMFGYRAFTLFVKRMRPSKSSRSYLSETP